MFQFAVAEQVFPGLHYHPTLTDLYACREAYNALPDDDRQPPPSEQHLHLLAALFTRYRAEKVFGIHLVHGHFKIPQNSVMLGSSIANGPLPCLTKPTDFSVIPLNAVHGHIYIVSPTHGLVAYEYREGQIPSGVAEVDPAFFAEFIAYLESNCLTGYFGLEVLDEGSDPNQKILEFVVSNQATLMLKEKDANYESIYRVTGWSLAWDNDIASFKGNESHAAVAGGSHQIFRDGKPLQDISTAIEVLKSEGVLPTRQEYLSSEHFDICTR